MNLSIHLPDPCRARSGLRCHPCRDERGDAQAHCPKGQALMRYLLDTNIVSAWARKNSSVLMLKLAETPPAALCVCTLVEHELLYGFALLPGTRAEAMTLRLLELLPSLPFGSAETRWDATMRVALARARKPIGPYDTLIAATALGTG